MICILPYHQNLKQTLLSLHSLEGFFWKYYFFYIFFQIISDDLNAWEIEKLFEKFIHIDKFWINRVYFLSHTQSNSSFSIGWNI